MVWFGLEMVALTYRQESDVEMAELKILRSCLGVTRIGRIRNKHIRGRAKDFLETKCGHVRRRDSGHIVRWCERGKFRGGTDRERWKRMIGCGDS